MLNLIGKDMSAGSSRQVDAVASELEEAVRQAEDEKLPPGPAAESSGYSERRLRELRAEGKLVDYGTPGRPLYRRGDLPCRVQGDARPHDFDPVEHVSDILRAGS